MTFEELQAQRRVATEPADRDEIESTLRNLDFTAPYSHDGPFE